MIVLEENNTSVYTCFFTNHDMFGLMLRLAIDSADSLDVLSFTMLCELNDVKCISKIVFYLFALSFSKTLIPSFSVLFFCSWDKVYHKQEVRFFCVYYARSSPDNHNPDALD